MKQSILGGVLLAAALMGTGAAWAQSQEGSRGSLPDGETDRAFEPPVMSLERIRPIPLPELDLETVRGLPFDDPARLESGFGTVTRHSNGRVTEEGPAQKVLDALRSRKAGVGENSRPPQQNDEDPFFASDETDRQVIGSDSRIRVQNSASYPFRTFGLLVTERGSCTGTLIGAYTVLTAAHCVYKHSGGWANEVTFYPGANGNGNFPYRGYNYREATIMRGYIENFTGKVGSAWPWDLAIIHLWQAAGDSLGTLGYSSNTGYDFHAYLVGYPGDKPNATMWRTSCDFNYSNVTSYGTSFVHHCDTYSGTSGSSMYRYVKAEDKRFVGGVNVGSVTYSDASMNHNVGVLLTPEYFNWVNNLRY